MSENTPYNKGLPDPRQYSLVKFDATGLPIQYQMGYPFSLKHRYIFLGEIPNMRGHCIVMDDKGKNYIGYHTENFIELTDDELDEFPPVGYNP